MPSNSAWVFISALRPFSVKNDTLSNFSLMYLFCALVCAFPISSPLKYYIIIVPLCNDIICTKSLHNDCGILRLAYRCITIYTKTIKNEAERQGGFENDNIHRARESDH